MPWILTLKFFNNPCPRTAGFSTYQIKSGTFYSKWWLILGHWVDYCLICKASVHLRHAICRGSMVLPIISGDQVGMGWFLVLDECRNGLLCIRIFVPSCSNLSNQWLTHYGLVTPFSIVRLMNITYGLLADDTKLLLKCWFISNKIINNKSACLFNENILDTNHTNISYCIC